MKKILQWLIVSAMLPLSVAAQPSYLWDAVTGDAHGVNYSNAATGKDQDGNAYFCYVRADRSGSSFNVAAFILEKRNEFGVLAKTKTVATNSLQIAAISTFGETYIVNNDAQLSLYDSSLSKVWKKNLVQKLNPLYPTVKVLRMVADKNGDMIIGGYYQDNLYPTGIDKLFIAKFSREGKLVFNYEIPATYLYFGIGALDVDKNGDIYAAYNLTENVSPYHKYVHYLNLDKKGNLIWDKTTSIDIFIDSYQITAQANGWGYLSINELTYFPADSYNTRVLQFDKETGNEYWETNLNYNKYIHTYSLNMDHHNDIVLTGYAFNSYSQTSTASTLTKINAKGNIVFIDSLNTTAFAPGVLFDDANYIYTINTRKINDSTNYLQCRKWDATGAEVGYKNGHKASKETWATNNGVIINDKLIYGGSHRDNFFSTHVDDVLVGYYSVCFTTDFTAKNSTVNMFSKSNVASHADNSLIKIFPNPAGSFITVQLPQMQDADKLNMRITNAQGIIVWQQNIAANQLTNKQLNVSSLPQGNYYMQVVNAKNITVVAEKIIIAR